MRKFTLFAILSVLAVLSVACDDSSSGASNADEQAEANSSESTIDEGISSAEDAILYSSTDNDEGTSDTPDNVVKESSSSDEVQEITSSETSISSSSEATSSSTETKSSSSEDVFHYYDQTIYKFNGDTTEIQEAGRFRVIFNNGTCSSRDVYDNLKDYGVEYASHICNNSFNKHSKLFRSSKNIKKYVLDSLIEGFFNSITVDDTNKIEIEFDPRDWQETVRICDEEKNCHYETIEKDSIYMFIYYWEDISGDKCTEIVEDCGAVPVEECWDNYGIGIMAPKSSIECLESSRDIMYIQPAHYVEVLD